MDSRTAVRVLRFVLAGLLLTLTAVSYAGYVGVSSFGISTQSMQRQEPCVGDLGPAIASVKWDSCPSPGCGNGNSDIDELGDDYAYGVAVDSQGNIIVTGKSHNGSDTDYYTIKYDSALSQIPPAVSYDTEAFDIARGVATDSQGNIIVTGGCNEHFHAGSPHYKYCTIKYDPTLTPIWYRFYEGPAPSEKEDIALAVATDEERNVIVTGMSWNGDDWDYYTIKYDENGTVLWQKRFDSCASPSDEDRYVPDCAAQEPPRVGHGDGHKYPSQCDDKAFGVTTDTQGNVIVTGGYKPNSDDDMDWCTIKYDYNGVLGPSIRYQNSLIDEAYAVATDLQDNIIVTGRSDQHGGGEFDYLTIKYDPALSPLFPPAYYSSNMYENMARGVATDKAGNIFVTGWDWKPGTQYDYYTIMYDPTLAPTSWDARYVGASGQDAAEGVATFEDRERDIPLRVIVTGGSHNGFDWDYCTIMYQPYETSAVLFHDDFEDGIADGWDLEPGWQIAQDDGNYVLSGEGHQWATLVAGHDWTDYSFRFRLKPIEGTIHLNFRLTDQPLGLTRYFVGFMNDGLYLRKMIRGNDSLLAHSDTLHRLGVWRDVEIVADGGHLQVYVDGVLEIDYVDDDPIPRGSIGFEPLDNSHAYIDDVEVTGLR